MLPALLVTFGCLWAGDKKPKPAETYGVIAGTVFRDTGLSLPGAEVAVSLAGDSKEARKFKKLRYITDARGEFAVRVPAQPAEYTVTVVAPGYKTGEKTVSIAGEDRVDVFFRLEPASN